VLARVCTILSGVPSIGTICLNERKIKNFAKKYYMRGTDPTAFCTNDAKDMSSILKYYNWNVKVYKGARATKKTF